MWRDVVIGDGNWGNTASSVYGTSRKSNLSQNSTSYWISDVFEGIGMTIFKDTPEGQHITKLIEEGAGPEVVDQYVQEVFFTRLPVDKLKAAIEARAARAFEEGKQAKVKELNRLLPPLSGAQQCGEKYEIRT